MNSILLKQKNTACHCFACICAKSLQWCLILCDPLGCSPRASLSIRFSMQAYWSGLPFPPPGNLPEPGIEPRSLMSPELAGRFFTHSTTWEAHESENESQSCPTLCNSMDYTVHGIFQAIILEWVAFPFSRGSFQPRDRTQVSHIAGGFFTS